MTSTRTFLPAILALLICALATGCATPIGLAVKRGQVQADPNALPFVCLVVGTSNIGMPLHSVTLLNAATSQAHTAIVSKTFGGSKPDYLTAIDGKDMLCLVVLEVPPGEYYLKAVEYTGNKNDSYSYTFDFSAVRKLKIVADRKSVNYVGSVVIAANWRPMLIRPTNALILNSSFSDKLPAQLVVKDTAARDLAWARDQIPALRNLPFTLSRIQEL